MDSYTAVVCSRKILILAGWRFAGFRDIIFCFLVFHELSHIFIDWTMLKCGFMEADLRHIINLDERNNDDRKITSMCSL